MYKDCLHSGINLLQLNMLRAAMAACKVLVDTYVQTGIADHICQAERIRADVEETEAILAGYWGRSSGGESMGAGGATACSETGHGGGSE